MQYRFVPGQLVEVVRASAYPQYIGERFVLRKRVRYAVPAWQSPWRDELGLPILAEELALKPVDDNGDFMRFMEKTLRPLPQKILDPVAN